MKRFSYFLLALFIFIIPVRHVFSSNKAPWDFSADQKIKACFASDKFQNVLLFYSYNKRNWKLRIIFNPKSEKILLGNGQNSMLQMYYGVFTQDMIPENLKKHIGEIIQQQGILSGGFWSICSSFSGKPSIDYLAGAKVAPGSGETQSNRQGNVDRKPTKVCKTTTAQDQTIQDLFKSQTFKKLLVNYQWEGKPYPVYFVYNPKKELLSSEKPIKPLQCPLAMTIDANSYPLSLGKHLKSLVPGVLLKDPTSVIDIADSCFGQRKNSVSFYASLYPVLMLNKIENCEIDADIQKLFTSDELSKKSLCYELDGNFYRVLLIHNPKNLNLKATLSFETWEYGHIMHTTHWSSKIGIFVDKEAPQELIDHISKLFELSYWDSFWNLSIHNGDKVSVTRCKHSLQYTYTPYSQYTFMINAEP